MFSKEPNLIKVSSPCVIVGDLHGHLIDLIRIFNSAGTPQNTKYIFLGDIVDRGEFSIETVTYLFAMKVLFPKNVIIIRGNHEFNIMNYDSFGSDLQRLYGNRILSSLVNEAFEYLPFAVLVDGKSLCIHGGLGPHLFGIHQIEEIKRPVTTFSDDDNISSLVWSDPVNVIDYFGKSSRGTGYFFGEKATHEFLDQNGIDEIIRGHQCVEEGYMKTHHVITIFSASNYCGRSMNKSAILVININGREVRTFQPYPYIYRKNVDFFKIYSGKKEKCASCARLTSYPSIETKLPLLKKIVVRHRISDPRFNSQRLSINKYC